MGDARKNERIQKEERKKGGGQGPRKLEQDLGKENRAPCQQSSSGNVQPHTLKRKKQNRPATAPKKEGTY